MWAILALASSLAFCFVSVCDKRLLSFHFQGVPPLCLWCGICGVVYGSVMLLIVGIPEGTSWEVALSPVAAGLLMGCSVALLFRGLRLMEASRAVAIAQTNPIYVAILAMLFLDEHISLQQWGGIGLVVIGAVLISVRLFQERPLGRIGPGAGIPSTAVSTMGDRSSIYGPAILLMSAVCAAGSFVVTKASLNADLPVLTVFGMQQATVGAVFVAVGLSGGRSAVRRLVSAMKQPTVLGMLITGEALMPAISILLAVYAYSLGPASLVAAVLATRPLFVFVASTVLSRVRWQLMDESLTPQALAVKGSSIVMIVVGVGALSLA